MNKKLAATSSAIITAILSAVILVEGGYTDDPYDRVFLSSHHLYGGVLL